MPTTSNFGWTTPADTDLVKDGAAAIRTLGNGIDTSFLDLKGGTTDQVLAKNSNTDLDFKWVAQDDSNAIQNAIVDAKGDLISATAADTPARLAVGANGTVLTADSAETTGLKWVTPAGGGKVLQVVSTTKTDVFSSTSTSFTDVTGLSVTITPSSASSKVLILYNIATGASSSELIMMGRLLRDSTVINLGDAASNRQQGFFSFSGVASLLMVQSGVFLDSPATTSATTYKIQVRGTNASYTYRVNAAQGDDDTSERLRAASTITVLEIGA